MHIARNGHTSAVHMGGVLAALFLLAAACGREQPVPACQGEICCSEGTRWSGGRCRADAGRPQDQVSSCVGAACCAGRTMFDQVVGLCFDPELRCPEFDAVVVEHHFPEDELVPAGGTFVVSYNVYACRPIIIRSFMAQYAFEGRREAINGIESVGLSYNNHTFAEPRPLALPHDSADVPFPRPIELPAGIVGSFELETLLSPRAPSGQRYAILYMGMDIHRSDKRPAQLAQFITSWLQFEVR